MSKESEILAKLEEIKTLIKQQIAVQLYIAGLNQDEIATNLKTSKTTVNTILKGLKPKKKDSKVEENGDG